MNKLLILTCAAAIGIAANAATLNLSTVTTDTTIPNGTTVVAALGSNVKLSIAAGATITLKAAQIHGNSSSSYPWAGLTCLGDATIILEGNQNEIVGFSSYYPGIYVPAGCTLTIKGSGNLAVQSNRSGAGIGSANINAGDCTACGNIVIEGGTIVALSPDDGAGIGSGSGGSSCGNIMILGGTITARCGGAGAGIGSGAGGSSCGSIAIVGGTVQATGSGGIGSGSGWSSCGDILIGSGVSSVYADGESGADNIGAGFRGSTCGTVAIAKDLMCVGGVKSNSSTINIRHVSGVQNDISLANGSVLTGTLAANVKVSIVDGATVTLRDATINGVNNSSYKWAGLTCLGNATIILEGSNTVRGYYEDYPGIYVPVGSTLTIKGDGSLDASSNGYGAGIGGGFTIACGNIRIEGGTITATGAIMAAGIGGGRNAACGDITITKGVTSVTATQGRNEPYCIGKGSGGSVGTVTIGGVVTGTITEPSYTYTPNLDLTSVTADVILTDGMTLTRTLSANVKVSIADGATVTLRNVTITGVNNSSYKWAGLTCLGNATIILEGSNTVRGYYEDYPGIYVPVGSTLTIKGDGSLDASSNGYGAGIGAGFDTSCGNIRIEGGTVNAIGGQYSAGIGASWGGNCGDITITMGVTSVTATKGSNSIGAGDGGTCGTVTIGGVVTGNISESPYTYTPTRVNLAEQSGNYTAADGEVLYGETAYAVTVPGGASVMINGVEVAGGGGAALPAPTFSADGKAATTEFVQGAGGKWTLTTFAELGNDALGADVANSQIKVYSSSTVEGLESASPMSSGVEVKEKKSAVKTTIEVTPPSGASQFFKVKFGE